MRAAGWGILRSIDGGWASDAKLTPKPSQRQNRAKPVLVRLPRRHAMAAAAFGAG